jgi:hypothetical protein
MENLCQNSGFPGTGHWELPFLVICNKSQFSE